MEKSQRGRGQGTGGIFGKIQEKTGRKEEQEKEKKGAIRWQQN